jgi:hypothetical protein
MSVLLAGLLGGAACSTTSGKGYEVERTAQAPIRVADMHGCETRRDCPEGFWCSEQHYCENDSQ